MEITGYILLFALGAIGGIIVGSKLGGGAARAGWAGIRNDLANIGRNLADMGQRLDSQREIIDGIAGRIESMGNRVDERISGTGNIASNVADAIRRAKSGK